MAVTPNYYETLYVTRPDIKEDDLAKIQQKLLDSISTNQGEVIRDDKWAERELAYEIQDHKRGIYYILIYKAFPDASKEIEKHLQFYRTDVLRFMTLKTTEEAANKNKGAKEDKAPKSEAPAPPAQPEPTPAPVEAATPAPKVEPEPAPAAPAPPVSAEEPVAETKEETPGTPEQGGTQ